MYEYHKYGHSLRIPTKISSFVEFLAKTISDDESDSADEILDFVWILLENETVVRYLKKKFFL